MGDEPFLYINTDILATPDGVKFGLMSLDIMTATGMIWGISFPKDPQAMAAAMKAYPFHHTRRRSARWIKKHWHELAPYFISRPDGLAPNPEYFQIHNPAAGQA